MYGGVTEVGAVFFQAEQNLADVPRPPVLNLHVCRGLRVERLAVVEEDRRLGVTEPLEVEKVTERVLEEMHPVDEREVEVVAPQHLPEVMTLEEVVTALRKDLGGLVDGEADVGLGI